MTQPLVSIVCTVYNKAPWLEQAIDSFLNQVTDFPYEIVLIDDCSTDNSRKILARYQHAYPERIRVYYNEENLGIARTWLKVCDLIETPYLARCDGDDYWIDSGKLQRQLDALLANPASKWSSTDIDFVDEEDQVLIRSVFESGQMPYVHDFETMLATRGFLAPSTWLVETKLMQEVNHGIDVNTADDTFDMQLDLFQKTSLTYIPQSTVAYRVNQGSDSRPTDFAKLEYRFNALLATQNAYLDKYPQSNYREMLRILLDRNNRYELELTRQSAGLEQLGFERVTLYFDRAGHGFCEEDTRSFPLQHQETLSFRLPEDCQRVRIDVSERPSFYRFIRLKGENGAEIAPQFHNGIHTGDFYLFPNPDPQLIYELPKGRYGKSFTLSYHMCELNDLYSDDYLGKVLAQELLDLSYRLAAEVRTSVGLLQEKLYLTEQVKKQQANLEELTHLYNSVVFSRRWKIPTKIINFFRRKS